MPYKSIIKKSQVEEIRSLIGKDLEKDNQFRTLAYITEEVGELSEALQDKSNEEAQKECLDILISTVGMYLSLGGDFRFSQSHIKRQLNKWRAKLRAKAMVSHISKLEKEGYK